MTCDMLTPLKAWFAFNSFVVLYSLVILKGWYVYGQINLAHCVGLMESYEHKY